MNVKFQLLALLIIWIDNGSSSKPVLTLDEFLNYTAFSSLTLAPDDGQSILIQTNHRRWDENSYDEHLYLQSLRDGNKKLITTHASGFKSQWKDKWIALILSNNSSIKRNKQKDAVKESQYIHLYSIVTNQIVPLLIGNEEIHVFTWSTTSMSLLFCYTYTMVRRSRRNIQK